MIQADPALFNGDHGGKQTLGIFPQRQTECGLLIIERIQFCATLIFTLTLTLTSILIFTLILTLTSTLTFTLTLTLTFTLIH